MEVWCLLFTSISSSVGEGDNKKNLTVFLDISVNSEAPLNYSIFIEKKENLFNI